MASKNTSWGEVAKWYEDTVEGTDSYQNQVIKPNLLRTLSLKKGERILDLACGSGFFTKEFSASGAISTGVDIGRELIELAKKNDKHSTYLVGNAEKMPELKPESFNAVVVVLAIQNIKDLNAVCAEISRVLSKNGRIILVLNHPAYRIPKASEWGYDNIKNVQYRRVDKYMSEFFSSMDMNPGEKNVKIKKATVSFHRPLQVYFKAFAKAGLFVTKLEEWTSHKVSDKGTRKEAEDQARKEFPLFMALELRKII